MKMEETSGALAPIEPEFEAIEAAVNQTARGRGFLAEFAKRNRQIDTERLLAAIARLESRIAEPVAVQGAPDPEMTGLRRAICEMAEDIAVAKREVAAIKPQNGEVGELTDATAELDAIVSATERATSEILEAAEQVQEVAWTLREAGADDAYCDVLDIRATEIYTACSFQDITGQRTSKIVRVLHTLETRINTMAELWGGMPVAAAAERSDTNPDPDSDVRLLNGPALEGQGPNQEEVDRMIEEFRGGTGAADAAEMADTAPPEGDDAIQSVPQANGAAYKDFDLSDDPVVVDDGKQTDDADDLAKLSPKDYEAMLG